MAKLLSTRGNDPMIYGYARVSTKGQAKDGNSLDCQESTILQQYPTAVIINESYSGAKVRPAFTVLLDKLAAGDILAVTKLDRFCRSTKEGLEYIDSLMKRGVKIHILNMGLIEDTPMGRMMITNLLAFAEFERAMILERTSEGKERAKLNENFVEGRPPIKKEPVVECYKLVQDGLISVTEAVKRLGISRSSWYNITKGLPSKG